jgi:hypothetical protein
MQIEELDLQRLVTLLSWVHNVAIAYDPQRSGGTLALVLSLF